MSFVRIGKLTWFEFPLPYVSKFFRSHKKSKNKKYDWQQTHHLITQHLQLLSFIPCHQEHLILFLLQQAGIFCLIITTWELPRHPAGIILYFHAIKSCHHFIVTIWELLCSSRWHHLQAITSQELPCHQEHLILLLLKQARSSCLIITRWELPCHPAGIILYFHAIKSQLALSYYYNLGASVLITLASSTSYYRLGASVLSRDNNIILIITSWELLFYYYEVGNCMH